MLTSDNSHSGATSSAAAPRKLPRQRRSRETVERILDTAARIFDDRGYRATTTNDVAEAAGISIGSLYQYFPNKDALLVALADRHLEAALPVLLDVAADVRARGCELYEAFTQLAAASLRVNRSDNLHHLLWSAPRTPELAARLHAAEEVMVSEIVWHLERAGWSGERVAVRARLIVVAVESAVHDPVLAEDPDALVSELVAMCAAP